MNPLPAGRRIHERQSLQYGVVGGWFRSRATGRPVLLTAAHLLTPDSIRFAAIHAPSPVWGRPVDRSQSPTVEAMPMDVILAEVPSETPVARVVARAASRDACIAEALDDRLATPLVAGIDGVLAPDEAVLGHEVVLVSETICRGTVIAVDHHSTRRPEARQLLIESVGGGPMGGPGDSGAPIIDLVRRTVVGIHLGATRDPRIGRAAPLVELLELFDLTAP